MAGGGGGVGAVSLRLWFGSFFYLQGCLLRYINCLTDHGCMDLSVPDCKTLIPE